jgi:phosphate transport system permease protein
VSRAIGETMAVALAAGQTPNLTFDFRESIMTMTAYIVQVTLGDAAAGSIAFKTLFAVAALLFLITLTMNLIAHLVLRRFREVYE